MASTVVTRGKPDPRQHRPGEAPSTHEAGNEEEQGQGPTPRTAATASMILGNSSITPGPLWIEMINPAAFALAVGANTLTGELPKVGAGWLLQYQDKPILAAVVPPMGTIEAEPESGLPVPQSNKKLTNVTALPAAAGIRNVTVNATATPPTITINIYAQTAGTVAAGSRWLVFNVQGV